MAVENRERKNAMSYKIIASDLDGTLLNKDGVVSPENWAAIRKLHEMGIFVVPASGRAYTAMPQELRESPYIRFYITSDGTTVYDKDTDTTHELPMDRALAHEVLDKLYSYPVCPMVHADINSYVDMDTHNAADYESYHMNPYWVAYTLKYEIPKANFKEFIYNLPTIQSVVPFFMHHAHLEECKAYFEKDPRLLVVQSDPEDLEVFSVNAGKGNALRLLASLLDVDEKNTIAVGDSTNDKTMVEAAGLGLAVENAVPELKAAADKVVCHHTQHVMQYILENFIDTDLPVG